MKAASVARGLTGQPRTVTLDGKGSVSGLERDGTGDRVANIATPEGGSSSDVKESSDA